MLLNIVPTDLTSNWRDADQVYTRDAWDEW